MNMDGEEIQREMRALDQARALKMKSSLKKTSQAARCLSSLHTCTCTGELHARRTRSITSPSTFCRAPALCTQGFDVGAILRPSMVLVLLFSGPLDDSRRHLVSIDVCGSRYGAGYV